ncbi:MAG: SRPBCC family protein [Rhodobacteraceae bacterium]|nr:SRPBCC family protein [Paracoccaceae bacterium]
MIRVANSTILRAPIARVWEVLRDFNGHDSWHPAVTDSKVERGLPGDKVGCVRAFHLKDGAFLREQLLSLSDIGTSYAYCLLDTPIPLFNYVSHVRLVPVTDGDWCFWEWTARFGAPKGQARDLAALVGDDIQLAGFEAIRREVE